MSSGRFDLTCVAAQEDSQPVTPPVPPFLSPLLCSALGVRPALGSLLRTECYSSQCLGASEPSASSPFTGEVGVGDQAQLSVLLQFLFQPKQSCGHGESLAVQSH